MIKGPSSTTYYLETPCLILMFLVPQHMLSFHPHWLTSVIKSALMTTGQLNPVEAVDPGLVYEITKEEYLAMLCSMNVSRYGPCSPGGRTIDQKDLNYPSMAVDVTEEKPFKITFPITVRNVCFPDSTYQSLISASSQIKVSVEPSVFSFKSLDEKQSFVVTAEGQGLPIRSMASSSLEVVAASSRLQFGGTDDDKKQVYIVYMGSLPTEDEYSPLSHHVSILQQVVKGRSAADSLVRSYHRSFNAFAARLSSEEAHKISGMEKVLSVFPSKKIHLHTTRSWDFIGLTEREERNLAGESDVIIGVIDTGIWPESESFNDQGIGPPPERWKGRCEGGENFTCNNKIIGAQYYGESGSARDNDGHGSHTASIAAGSKVSGVEFYGLAQGNARGGAPSARIAVYKACEEYCSEQQILDAFNDAIDDGVDIISISLGIKYNNIPLEKDAIAIGSFHAMEKGVLTVHSAGNDGPSPGTIESTAPWLVSVAASTIDRKILDKVVLGDGQTIIGLGINSFGMNGNSPLTFGLDSDNCARICSDGCLDSNVVKGKIVVCERDLATYPFDEPLKKGAVGAIALGTDQDNLTSYVDPLPASTLRDNDIDAFMSYFNFTANPEGTILQSEQMTDEDAPEVAAFSSRGPNSIVPNILKPDITAPGRYILAAYSLYTSPSGNIDDKRTLKYNILSGTSMACPHVSGAAAYVKSFHPHWLTSAIKSALMTTALPMNDTTTYDREFAYGAGQLNPTEAVDPGLVYEITKDEYLAMLCSMNISRYGPCPPGGRTIDQKDLNYPSMAVEVTAEEPFKITFPRTARNVGFPDSTYQSLISASSQIKVSVEPSVLSFLSLDEKQSFVVTVEGQGLPIRSMASSSLEWSDGTHSVRSPIVVYTSGGPLE